MTKEQVYEYIKRRKAKAGTWTNLAESLDIDLSLLIKIGKGQREPTDKVLAAFGIERGKETFRFKKPETK